MADYKRPTTPPQRPTPTTPGTPQKPGTKPPKQRK